MKFNKLYTVLLVLIAALIMGACDEYEDTVELSPEQEDGTQAFIYINTPTDLTFTPDLDQSFDITLGRHNEEAAASFSLEVTDENSIFSVPSEVSFTAGETKTTVTITFDLAVGSSGELTLVVPKKDSYWYGNDSITISVERDYTWLDAGTVSFTSDWAGATADLTIENAKEDANLYRIISPYYVLEPDYCPNEGYHIQFTLDDNYNAESVITSNIGEESSYGGYWWLYWDSTGPYGSYCTFTNDGSSYAIYGIWAYGTDKDNLTPYDTATESFIWTEGYPGE